MRRVAVLVAAAALLAGCAGVPTSGPIEQGPVVAPAGEDQLVRVIARPPRGGMTPEEIVRGFQEATSSLDSGFSIAKQFLTTGAAASWNPSAGVLVSDSAGITLTRHGSVVEADGVLSGQIGPTGEYTVAEPGTRLSTSYGMTLVDGQWRISDPPNGLVLGPADIDRGYRSFDLYYFTRDFSTLVPAPITIPLSGSGLPTALMRGLVSGPTPWLAPAVRTAFPEGTKLALDSVTVNDGVADVQLSPQVLTADDTTRQKLSAQVVWTLRQLPEISGVRISVNGQPLTVPGAAAVQPISSWPLVDPNGLSDQARGYAVDKRGLLAVTTDGAVSVAARIKPALTLPAVSLDSGRVAGLSSDGRTLYMARLVDGATAAPRYSGGDLSRPSWDRFGAAWVVDRGVGLVMVTDGRVTRMPVAELPSGITDKNLAACAVSRDGARMALLVRVGTRVEPMLARIERYGDTVRVVEPRRIESVVTEAVDLAWYDADTLAVLGTSGASSLEILEIDVGSAEVRRFGAPESSLTLAAAPGRALIVGAGTALYRNVGNTWIRIAEAQDPVYPG